MSPTNNGVALDEVHDAYQDAYNSLTNAYWAASTIENKDKIHGVMDVVFDIITELNRESLEANSDDFKTLAGHLKSTNAEMTSLKGQIARLVAAVKVATQVASAIDKAISLAAKYFGI
jgi:hypothetical protein